MKRLVLFGLMLATVVGCKGSTPTAPVVKPPALDPYVTVRVWNHLDTTTSAGRANWRVYVLLSGPQGSQNGIAPVGTFTMAGARSDFAHRLACISVGADSIGQRFIAPFAIGDTVHADLQPASATDSIVDRWAHGNHDPADGYVMFALPPTDAWTSVQFADGHGLVPQDPIKWGWDWTALGVATFTERLSTDGAFCNQG